MVGETVIDCRPSLLPVSIPLSGLSPNTISGARSCVSYGPPEETGQSIMNMDTSEITIDRIIGFEWNESGTDVEDEMPTPVASPTQSVVPATPTAGTADPFGRGDDFDLELAKVMCDVSVLPSLVAPLQEVEVPPCANAADYVAPAAPALETVLESPGYTVPEDSGCSWLPGFVPVADVVSADEGGYLRSLREPLPPQAVTTTSGRSHSADGAAESGRDCSRTGYDGVPLIGKLCSDRTYPERGLLMRVTQFRSRGSRRWC